MLRYQVNELIDFLDRRNIAYQKFDHAPVFTCAEAGQQIADLPGQGTKHLFLTEERGPRLVLLMTTDKKRVDLKSLAQALSVKRFSFAAKEVLWDCLGVEPGAVTILGAINDIDRRVEIFIDSDLWSDQPLQCHPLVNTSTLVLPWDSIVRFFTACNHSLLRVDVIDLTDRTK